MPADQPVECLPDRFGDGALECDLAAEVVGGVGGEEALREPDARLRGREGKLPGLVVLRLVLSGRGEGRDESALQESLRERPPPVRRALTGRHG